MYPSTFYQPFYHKQSCGFDGRTRRSQPTPEYVCSSSPYTFNLEDVVSQQYIQRKRAAQAAALQHAQERERQRHLALEREQALERERRRQILARREYERQLERKRQEQAALRAYYRAEAEGRIHARRRAEVEEARRRKQREEESSFADLIDSLLRGATRSPHDDSRLHMPSEEQEAAQAQDFSESESEIEEADSDDEGLAMDDFLQTLFHGFGLHQGNDTAPAETAEPIAQQPTQANTQQDVSGSWISEAVNQSTSAGAPDDAESALEAIQQQFAEHRVRVERLETLDALEDKLDELTSTFTFPAHLDFQDPQAHPDATSSSAIAPSTSSIPPLAYTATNVPFHAHAQALVGLLVEADAVESDGDQEVRGRRKEFVQRVEAQLDALERSKDNVWQEQRQGC